jgi:hypothetical protein
MTWVLYRAEPQEAGIVHEAVENHHWRILRLFLTSLDEQELKNVGEQLHRELAARRDWDHNPVRLFFSSLTAEDLELARQAILNERAARRQEQNLLGLARTKSRKA